MPRFCRFCGKELEKTEARFCPDCGKPIGEELDQAQAPHLFIRVPSEPSRQVTLDRSTYTIGRSAENDIVLSPNYVSVHHGRIEQRDGAWHYTDLDSTNGTFVNGQKEQSAVLRNGDVLRIGDPHGNSVGLIFRLPEEEDGLLPAAAGPIRMDTTALGMEKSLLIGRDPEADIHLEAPLVSWHHAQLERTAEGHTLIDLKSTNGTFVNGQRLEGSYLLEQGDVVQLGPFQLVYAVEGLRQYSTMGGMRLDGFGLVREIKRRRYTKRIIDDINISVHPREFVALVGTSGAGKSTLLMALNGFARAQMGRVLVNGEDLYQHFDLYRTMVGYVPQQDIIHDNLTVSNTLRYAAQLRLPGDTTDEEIEQRIDQVLEQVEMVGQKDQLISSLSGGQRQRVSIAVELLGEPSLFFLDEPTSGLDPGLEKKMMSTLRRLADGGRTILLVTHATANIVQCDHVCFLSQGRMVYFGPPEEALQFFGVTSGDFADIYAQLDNPDPQVAKQLAVEWEARFKHSSYYQQYVQDRQQTVPEVKEEAVETKAQRRPKVSLLRQFFVLTRRYLDLVLRDRLLLAVLMAIMPAIGALILMVADANWLVGNSLAEIEQQLLSGLAAGENSVTYIVVSNTQVLLFILTLAAVLLGLFAAVYEIVKEWSIYQRERMVAVRILPYIASKVMVLGLFALAQCLLLLLVISLRVDLPREGVILPAPLEMYITLVLGTMAALLMGLFISAIVPNSNAVIYIVLLVLFFQMIFAGVLFDLPSVANPLSVLTMTRWGMEGLGASANMEGLDGLTRTRFQPDPITEEIAIPVSDTEVVRETITIEPDSMDIYNRQEFQIQYARTPAHLWLDWLVLAGFSLIFALGTAIVLKRRDVK